MTVILDLFSLAIIIFYVYVEHNQMNFKDSDITSQVGDAGLSLINDKTMENSNLGKIVWFRFLRGALAGAVSSGATITFAGQNTFADLSHFIATVSVALIVGALTGGILAIDKLLRAE